MDGLSSAPLGAWLAGRTVRGVRHGQARGLPAPHTHVCLLAHPPNGPGPRRWAGCRQELAAFKADRATNVNKDLALAKVRCMDVQPAGVGRHAEQGAAC